MSRASNNRDQRGYFAVGVQAMKRDCNYGTLFRSANIFGAAFIFLIGPRFVPQHSDTMKSHRHMPLFSYDTFTDFQSNRPYDVQLIGVELDEKSKPLTGFQHPQRAIYLLGAEDHGLSSEARKACQHIVQLPGRTSLNVSVAGSIVLYDRIAKLGDSA